jgi:hypothetical protein
MSTISAPHKPIYLRAGEDLDCDCGKRATVKVPYNPTPATTGYHLFCNSCHRDYKESIEE